MRHIEQDDERTIYILMVDVTDHITGLAGLTLAFTLAKDGEAASAETPVYVDRGSGVYAVTLTSAMTDTIGDLWLHVTATGADPLDVFLEVVEPPIDPADIADIQSRLPAALISGRIDATVGAMQSGVVTSSAVATGAIDADALASDAVTEIQTGLATATALSDVQSDVDTVLARLPSSLVSGRIDASVGAMAANVMTASALASDAVTEIQTGLATSSALSAIAAKVNDLEAVALGRWEVTDNQLVLYELDGTTPLATFDLFDDSGSPSMTRIFERVPA